MNGRTYHSLLRALSVALLLVIAGCGASVVTDPPMLTVSSTGEGPPTTTTQPSSTGTPQPGGYVEAQAVVNAPDEATVLSVNNSSVEEILPVQKAVRRAYPDSQTELHLRSTALERVEAELPQSALYRGDSFGWYVSYRDRVFRVRVIHLVG